ncbi:MAG: tRNA epoxyqueuosine(34) reductase QueG [Anaerolineae bacterium]|nr:tRNA epoxyqueuosine(34) reductase QueG [Anaerolineae bacterium]
MRVSATAIKEQAAAMGFDVAGVIRAEPSPQLEAYLRWVEAGMQGEMGYMARADRVARRRDLNVILPGVQSMVVVGLDYATGGIPQEVLEDRSRGRIAAYAWGVDYHEVMTPRLEALAAWLQGMSGRETQQRVYVDTGAILERSHAQQAGLGFTGKNTMLIHPRRGSQFFIGEILTDVEFDGYDSAGRETMCGRCTRCLSACPTDAFPRPHVLDARRCISYLTIEYKGMIERTLRPLMGNWVYGCDVCQEVCPFQRFAQATRERGFYAVDVEQAAPKLMDLLALDETGFRQRYYGSAIFRIKRERLVRNACVAAGNWGDEAASGILERLLDDPSATIRAHAAWALRQVAGDAARARLMRRLDVETDAAVRDDIAVLVD